jgi:hypothetical protein
MGEGLEVGLSRTPHFSCCASPLHSTALLPPPFYLAPTLPCVCPGVFAGDGRDWRSQPGRGPQRCRHLGTQLGPLIEAFPMSLVAGVLINSPSKPPSKVSQRCKPFFTSSRFPGISRRRLLSFPLAAQAAMTWVQQAPMGTSRVGPCYTQPLRLLPPPSALTPGSSPPSTFTPRSLGEEIARAAARRASGSRSSRPCSPASAGRKTLGPPAPSAASPRGRPRAR